MGLFDADDLVEYHCDLSYDKGYKDGYAAAQAEKHGQWIYEQLPLPLSDGSKECVRCSVCGTHWDNESNYCPYCGADMRGGEDVVD